jgi:hypothetical protein
VAPSELKVTRTALHVFVGKNQNGNNVRISDTTQVLVVVALLLSIVGLGVGMFVPVLRFEFEGLVGLVLNEIDGGKGMRVTHVVEVDCSWVMS